MPPSWAKTGTLTTNHTAGPSSTQTARGAKPWWRSTLPGRVNSSTWAAKNSTQARSSSKTVEQWTKALCASAFQYFQLLDIKVTTCSLYCKNDLEMSDAKEKQRFVLVAQTVFVVTCEIKHFPQCHQWDVMCLVWPLFKPKKVMSLTSCLWVCNPDDCVFFLKSNIKKWKCMREIGLCCSSSSASMLKMTYKNRTAEEPLEWIRWELLAFNGALNCLWFWLILKCRRLPAEGSGG